MLREHWLDALARGLASGVSRREALRRLGVAALGVAFAGRLAMPEPVAAGMVCPTGQTACPNPRTDRDRCVDLSRDKKNCGSCGEVCRASGTLCRGGACGCANGGTVCAKRCVRLDRDRKHCGACGVVCPAGSSCKSGKCTSGGCPNGELKCGPERSCTSVESSDQHCGRCDNACASSQRCVDGQCVCDATSCPAGCCDGATCMVNGMLTCGTAGGACQVCDPSKADRCAIGQCRCVSSVACAAGQLCTGAGCVCDENSCSNGCCSGKICEAGTSLSACGGGGLACTVCDNARADNCTSGQCRCGEIAACGEGLTCLGGQCTAG